MKETFKLRDHSLMPKIGLGTWKLGDQTKNVVNQALKYGYTHVDTATFYQNAKDLKEIFKQHDFNRLDLFISTKLPAHMLTYEDTKQHYEQALSDFGLEYFNLYLINAPWPWQKKGVDHSKELKEVWRAMEDLYLEERVSSIGVSNFSVDDLKKLIETARMIPFINQVQVYPGHVDQALISYCESKGIIIQAYAPFNHGEVLNNQIIIDLAKTYHVTPAQLIIKWLLQLHMCPIFMTKNEEHLALNLTLDFDINASDVKRLMTLKTSA